MGDLWITDMRHFLGPVGEEVDLPSPVRLRASYFASIVQLAVCGEPEVQCRRRPGHRRCQGRIEARFSQDVPDEVQWQCPLCNDRGFLSGWRDTRWDPAASTPRPPASARRRSTPRKKSPAPPAAAPDARFPSDIEIERVVAALADKFRKEASRKDPPVNRRSMRAVARFMTVAQKCAAARSDRGMTLRQAAAASDAPPYRLQAIEEGTLSLIHPEVLRRYLGYLELEDWYAAWEEANPDTASAIILGLA